MYSEVVKKNEKRGIKNCKNTNTVFIFLIVITMIGLTFLAVSYVDVIAGFRSLNSFTKAVKIAIDVFVSSAFHSSTDYRLLLLKCLTLISDLLDQLLPRDSHFLLMGFIFGQQENITAELRHIFKVTGIMHLVVASGSNVNMIISSSQSVLSRFCLPRRFLYLVIIWLVWTYCVLLSFNPPIFRASLMASFFIVSSLISRQYQPSWFLLLSFFLMILINSTYLTNLSFQLSVVSSLGIIIGVSLTRFSQFYFLNLLDTGIISKFNRNRPFDFVITLFREGLLTTFWAQLFSLPIILINFHQFSFISIFANSVLLILVPVINFVGIILIGSLFVKNLFPFLSILTAFFFILLTKFFYFLVILLASWGKMMEGVIFTRELFLIWWLGLVLMVLVFYSLENRNKKLLISYD